MFWSGHVLTILEHFSNYMPDWTGETLKVNVNIETRASKWHRTTLELSSAQAEEERVIQIRKRNGNVKQIKRNTRILYCYTCMYIIRMYAIKCFAVGWSNAVFWTRAKQLCVGVYFFRHNISCMCERWFLVKFSHNEFSVLYLSCRISVWET